MVMRLAGCGLGQCPSVFEAPDNGFYVVGRIPIGVDPEITKRMSEAEQVVWIPRDVALEFARAMAPKPEDMAARMLVELQRQAAGACYYVRDFTFSGYNKTQLDGDFDLLALARAVRAE